ncbi:MAG: glutathione S-transferase family protein [Methylococcaceae bacterium]|nr:glutathione S-transferase family protein [Methylococcaceae bacterium]MCI0668678.1 glutathione S-transferase family protein [Methylococcaceae bacterium]
MIKLYQFARIPNVPNQSQFCSKVETYLRLAKLPYAVEETLPMKAPRGKLPYIEDNGTVVSDSRLIVEYLKSTYGERLDNDLTDLEIATARSLQRLIEEHFYWVTMYTRWLYTEENWQQNKRAIFGVLPPVIRDAAAAIYRRLIKGQIHGHGLGRLSTDEIFDLGKTDIDTIATVLDEKPYMMGSHPTTIDATAFGFLTTTLNVPIESPVKAYAQSKSNLARYCNRMTREFFPEIG